MKLRLGIILFVINNQQKLLILHQKKSNTFSLISGGLEGDENELDGVIREAKEETGLEIDKSKLIETNEFIEFSGSRKGPARQKAFVYFANDPKILVDHNEIDTYLWCDTNEFIERLKDKPPIIGLYHKLKSQNLL